jgi:hypothetical protein
VVSFLRKYPYILRVFCEVEYFIRFPTGHAGQPATEFLEINVTKLVTKCLSGNPCSGTEIGSLRSVMSLRSEPISFQRDILPPPCEQETAI